MVTDYKLYFDGEDGAIAITTDTISDNVLDLSEIEEVAKGSPVYLNIYVSTAFESADTAGVLAVDLVSSSGSTPDSSDVFQTIVNTQVASDDDLTKGLLYRGVLPEGIPYDTIGLSYRGATTDLEDGKVIAFLSIGSAND